MFAHSEADFNCEMKLFTCASLAAFVRVFDQSLEVFAERRAEKKFNKRSLCEKVQALSNPKLCSYIRIFFKLLSFCEYVLFCSKLLTTAISYSSCKLGAVSHF